MACASRISITSRPSKPWGWRSRPPLFVTDGHALLLSDLRSRLHDREPCPSVEGWAVQKRPAAPHRPRGVLGSVWKVAPPCAGLPQGLPHAAVSHIYASARNDESPADAGLSLRAGDRIRTDDPLFTRQALYQLSYSGVGQSLTRCRWRAGGGPRRPACSSRGRPTCARRARRHARVRRRSPAPAAVCAGPTSAAKNRRVPETVPGRLPGTNRGLTLYRGPGRPGINTATGLDRPGQTLRAIWLRMIT